MDNKYAVFILSHGRPNNIMTYDALRCRGYTGKIYIIVDDEDTTIEEYKNKFGEDVIVFVKKDYIGTFDVMDNFTDRRTVVYARNACYDIARKLGLDYFFEYEDDYMQFQYKYMQNGILSSINIQDIDILFQKMIDILKITNIASVAFAQGGDFIGGSFYDKVYKRKVMNTFCFRANKNPENDIKFIGRMNDDANTYLTQGNIGKLFFQIAQISVIQTQTQKNVGGNTEIYKKFGTYVKSFYSIMAMPSCVKIDILGQDNKRIHHRINWNNAVPKILRESVKNT